MRFLPLLSMQLPYIDAIESRQIDNKEVIAAMSATGRNA